MLPSCQTLMPTIATDPWPWSCVARRLAAKSVPLLHRSRIGEQRTCRRSKVVVHHHDRNALIYRFEHEAARGQCLVRCQDNAAISKFGCRGQQVALLLGVVLVGASQLTRKPVPRTPSSTPTRIGSHRIDPAERGITAIVRSLVRHPLVRPSVGSSRHAAASLAGGGTTR